MEFSAAGFRGCQGEGCSSDASPGHVCVRSFTSPALSRWCTPSLGFLQRKHSHELRRLATGASCPALFHVWPLRSGGAKRKCQIRLTFWRSRGGNVEKLQTNTLVCSSVVKHSSQLVLIKMWLIKVITVTGVCVLNRSLLFKGFYFTVKLLCWKRKKNNDTIIYRN